MEKIFDIAKDSEQKWGVIAQAIDRNNERLYLYTQENVSDAVGHMEGTEVYLNSQDAANIRWNGDKFIDSDETGYNGVVFRCVKGVTYTPLKGIRLSFYVFEEKPYLGYNRQPHTYVNSTINPWTADIDGYMFFQFSTKDAISVNMGVSGYGVYNDIGEVKKNAEKNSEDITIVKNCINDIQTEIGIESKEYHLTSKDAANIRWNGSYFVESIDDGYNGVAIKCVKGATYTPLNERVTYYVFDYEPKVGEKKQPIEIKESTLDSWTAEQSGLYLWFNFPTREQISVNMSVEGSGIKDGVYSNKISIGNLLDIQQITEFSKGHELIRKKKNFKWKEFEKPIITLKCDDLNSDVDLVVKIVNDAGLPIVIAAPANKLTGLVNGIIMSDEKIGDTCADVCQFVVKNGGEIVAHSIATFTSEDYQTSIKPIFIDSKVEFMKIGIDIRGAAVSNSNPNDDLRNKLAPYLYFYYEYSNGYGQNLPYSYGDNNFSGVNDGSVKTLEQFKPILENAINKKSHKTYTIHSLSSSGITEEEYRKIVNYVLEKKNAGEIDVMTWAEVYDKYGIFE
jgi:hypothetical protein